MMGEMVENASILVVDDHEMIAQALAATLGVANCTVEHVVADQRPDVLREQLLGAAADVVVLDLDLGRAGDGTELIGPLTTVGSRVVVLTGIRDEVRHGRCLRAGAMAVLSKHRPFHEIREAVATAARGDDILDTNERQQLLQQLRDAEALRDELLRPFRELTPREAEVLGALMKGHTVAAIAEESVVATSTVRSQVRGILRKLRVHSQLEAVAQAREAGWSPPAECDG